MNLKVILLYSVNENNGTVFGEPLWRPDGGILNGAIELDGIDDYISVPLVLNLSERNFGVFLWIKGAKVEMQ